MPGCVPGDRMRGCEWRDSQTKGWADWADLPVLPIFSSKPGYRPPWPLIIKESTQHLPLHKEAFQDLTFLNVSVWFSSATLPPPFIFLSCVASQVFLCTASCSRHRSLVKDDRKVTRGTSCSAGLTGVSACNYIPTSQRCILGKDNSNIWKHARHRTGSY